MAEVDRHFQVARVEVREGRVFSDKSALDSTACNEYRPGGSVICSGRAIFLNATAKLAEGEHDNAFFQLRIAEIVQENLQRS